MAVLCPKCGHDNPAGVAVCARCAGPLANLCPHCNFENPAGFKFCGNCGANLLTATILRASDPDTLARYQGYIPSHLVEKILRVGKQIEGERRTVTVLFSDVVGFTSISERLDPEEVYTIIDACVAAFRDEIYKHEGTLDKFMGDGVMALFGAPVAHEDDAARALRCALGMQTALKDISANLVAKHGITLQIRIGLNLGTVVVGDIGSDLRMNYTALGDSVNVAARLQAVAEPGAILASRAVYEQTRALFEFRELGTIRVKGRVEPVEIFEVVSAWRAPGRVRGLVGITAPMVGREKELAQVQHVVEQLVQTRRGAALLITGEAGLGKSRLIAELKRHIANQPVRIVEGDCVAYGQSAYGVFINILRDYLTLAPDESEDTARAKIETRVKEVLGTEDSLADVLPYIEHLLAVPILEKEMADRIRHLEPAQLRQQIFLAVRDLWVAQARREPLLLIFEDLHWVDKLSLDLLLFLFNAVETAPICLYCTSRAADNQAAPQVDRVGYTTLGDKFLHLALEPLSLEDSAALVDLLLTIADLPESLRRLISQRAEGNPFYLEEIIRTLIDRHIIQQRGDRWEMTPGADSTSVEVPRTLEGLIMTRVDHLPETTRHTVQCAAVIGRDFSERLLRQITNGNLPRLEADLQDLSDRELIAVTAAEAERRYAFRHILTQQTVYNSLLMRRREQLHYKIAVGIEQLYPDRLDEQVEQLAFHYTESKDATRALPYVIRAAERAAARFANDAALEYYRTALDLVPNASASLEQRVQIFSGLGDAQNFVGDYDSALVSLRTALDLARLATTPARVGDAPVTTSQARQTAEIARRLGRVYERRGEYSEAMRWLEQALASLDRDPSSDHAVERVRLYVDTGWVHFKRGKLDEAYQWLTRAVATSDGFDYYAEMGSAYNSLAALFQYRGDSTRAFAYAHKSLALRETIGDTEGVSRSNSNVGAIAASRGEWNEAIYHLQRSLQLKQRIGDAKRLPLAHANLGLLYVYKGDAAQACSLLGEGLKLAEKIHDPNQICLALNGLAQAELLDDHWSAAIELLTTSLQTASQTEAKDQLADANWIIAEAELGAGHLDTAQRHALEALQLAQEIGLRQYEASALRVLGKLARRREQWHAGETDLSRSIAIFSELQNQFEAARSEFELAMLYLAQGVSLDARALLERCLDIFTRLGASHFRAHAERALAQLESFGEQTMKLQPAD